MPRVYLDSCVVIYYVERHPVLASRVEAALFPREGETPRPVHSDLTRLECRVGPLRRRDTALASRFDAFFALADCERAPLDAGVFDLATGLRAEHGLRTPDALHLAAAIRSNCGEFWTNDSRLAKAAAGGIAIILFDRTD